MNLEIGAAAFIDKKVLINKQRGWRVRDVSVLQKTIPPRNITTEKHAIFFITRAKAPKNECSLKIVVTPVKNLHGTIHDHGKLLMHLNEAQTINVIMHVSQKPPEIPPIRG